MQTQDKIKPLSTKKVTADDGTEGYLVRHNDRVEIKFNGSQFHKPGSTDKVHPALAAKLIYLQGVASLVDNSDKEAVDRFKPSDDDIKAAKVSAKKTGGKKEVEL